MAALPRQDQLHFPGRFGGGLVDSAAKPPEAYTP